MQTKKKKSLLSPRQRQTRTRTRTSFLSFSSQHTVSVTQLVMMALQLSSSVTTTTTPSSSSIRSHNYSVQRSLTAWSLIRKSELSPSKNGNLHSIGSRSRRMRSAVAVVVKCSSSGSLDTEEAVVNVGQVTEVDKDTFWPIVKAAGDKPVVLDMYTQWLLSISTLRLLTDSIASASASASRMICSLHAMSMIESLNICLHVQTYCCILSSVNSFHFGRKCCCF